LLATKTDINELIATTSIAYALVCKDDLISIHDMLHSLPPAVTNVLQEYFDVFSSKMSVGLPPIRGIDHQIDRIPNSKCIVAQPCAVQDQSGRNERDSATNARTTRQRLCT
jgi:hypothetical protein